jgi:polar amino acid transport system substrate-binding protein
MTARRLTASAITALYLFIAAGCGGSSTPSTAGSGTPSAKQSSTYGSFTAAQPGQLTVATNLPGPGFFDGDTPEDIHGGFEYAMAKEIAKRLGLPTVKVVNVSWDALVAGQAKGFDLALSTINITPERQKVVDFSVPYFNSEQGVLVRAGTKVDQSNVKSLRWGAQSSSTSQDFLNKTLKPDHEPRVYQDAPSMFAALASKQIDAVLLDTVAVLAQAKQSAGALEVVGQFKTGGVYGALFPKGDPNEGALNNVIKELKSDGTLNRLSAEILAPAFGQDPNKVPYLTP